MIGVSFPDAGLDAPSCQIFGFIAQILLTMGLQRERVGKAGVALYLSVSDSSACMTFVG